MSEEKIIDKVKKLLEVTTANGATEAEAAAAYLRVTTLLNKYSLSMHKVNSHIDVEHDKSMKWGDIKEESIWESMLMNVLCKYNLCKSISHTRKNIRGGSFSIIGETHNVEIVKYLFEVSRENFRSLSKQHFNELRKATMDAYDNSRTELELQKAKVLPYRTVWIRNYLKGAVIGLQMKFEEQRQAKMELNGDEYGLMVTSHNAQIAKYVENTFDNLTSGKKVSINHDSAAIKQGVRDGKNASLSQGVTGNSSTVKMIG